jgi:hypothetical protein
MQQNTRSVQVSAVYSFCSGTLGSDVNTNNNYCYGDDKKGRTQIEAIREGGEYLDLNWRPSLEAVMSSFRA